MGRISHLPYSNNVPLSKEASLLFAYKPQYLLYKLAWWWVCAYQGEGYLLPTQPPFHRHDEAREGKNDPVRMMWGDSA